jgi:hypothetical protein
MRSKKEKEMIKESSNGSTSVQYDPKAPLILPIMTQFL